MTTYEVTSYRDGSWWTFEIPALTSPGPIKGKRIVAMGQARRAEDVAREARDVIDLWTDDPDVDVRVHYTLPAGVETAVHTAAESEKRGRAALDEAAALRRQAVQALRSQGLSQADTATLLGLSRQRVQQLSAA